MILKNLLGTRWDQLNGDKRFVDHGQPVLMGFGEDPLNPMGVLIVTASHIANGRSADLRKLYDVWAGMRK